MDDRHLHPPPITISDEPEMPSRPSKPLTSYDKMIAKLEARDSWQSRGAIYKVMDGLPSNHWEYSKHLPSLRDYLWKYNDESLKSIVVYEAGVNPLVFIYLNSERFLDHGELLCVYSESPRPLPSPNLDADDNVPWIIVPVGDIPPEPVF